MRIAVNLNFNNSSSRSYAGLENKSKKIKSLQPRSYWSEGNHPETINQTNTTSILEGFPSLPEFVAGVNYAITKSGRTWII
jgi:hypothetical protein